MSKHFFDAIQLVKKQGLKIDKYNKKQYSQDEAQTLFFNAVQKAEVFVFGRPKKFVECDLKIEKVKKNLEKAKMADDMLVSLSAMLEINKLQQERSNLVVDPDDLDAVNHVDLPFAYTSLEMETGPLTHSKPKEKN